MTSFAQVTITSTDFAVALDFYDAALKAIGLSRLDELVDEEEDDAQVEAVAWGTADAVRQLWLIEGDTPTSGVHIRFAVKSRLEVESFYRAALRSGGQGLSQPRRWSVYRRGEFNAIVADPAGNQIEAVAPE